MNKLRKAGSLPPFILKTRYWLPDEIFFFRFLLTPVFVVLRLSCSLVLFYIPLLRALYLSTSIPPAPENIYYFHSVSLIRILKRGGFVMKNRGPFYRDIDDGKCFVRLSRWAHLETTLVPLSLSLFLSISPCHALFFYVPGSVTLNHTRGNKSYALPGQLIRHKISAKCERTSINGPRIYL